MYFRYLTFSCPGWTRFIHSTEEQRRGRPGGNVPGGLQAGSRASGRFSFSTSELTESRPTRAILRGCRSCCTAEQKKSRHGEVVLRGRGSHWMRGLSFASRHISMVRFLIFRDGYGFCSLTLSVHASLQTSLQSTSLTLVPMSLVNNACSGTRLTPDTRTPPSRHMYHLKDHIQKATWRTGLLKRHCVPPHL